MGIGYFTRGGFTIWISTKLARVTVRKRRPGESRRVTRPLTIAAVLMMKPAPITYRMIK
jgi:hypothetical protein